LVLPNLIHCNKFKLGLRKNGTNTYLVSCIELSYYDKTRNKIVYGVYDEMKLGKTQHITIHSKNNR